MPGIGLLVGGVNFTDLKLVLKKAVMEGEQIISPAVTINYGNFLQVTFDFIIIAFAIFMLIKAMNTLNRKKEEKAAAPAPAPVPEPSAEEKLLKEILDELKKKNA